MNVRYLLLTSTLLLAACGSETEVQVTSEQAKPDTTVLSQEVLQTEAVKGKPVGNLTVEASADNALNAPIAADLASAPGSESLLPLGRLVGIVNTGDYKQATIDNQGKVIRLREGDDWQGWRVEAIGQKKVVISRDNAQHSLLLLSEFRAPEATQNLAYSQQMPRILSDNTAPGTAEVPQFTQEQLTELRSRLLMGRSGQQTH